MGKGIDGKKEMGFVRLQSLSVGAAVEGRALAGLHPLSPEMVECFSNWP